jgi:hypothetical protein
VSKTYFGLISLLNMARHIGHVVDEVRPLPPGRASGSNSLDVHWGRSTYIRDSSPELEMRP